jgi:hypothetical protein
MNTATFTLVGSRRLSFEPSTAGAEAKIKMLEVSVVREKKTGKKIPARRRVESIFLEEDRGDISIMLHCTRTVQ